jgi:CheY-like chemotaxis protein
VLERLKNDVATRHIPVCIVSTEDAADRATAYGPLCVVTKPLQDRDTLERLLDTIRGAVRQRVKDVLLVAADAARRNRLVEHVGAADFRVSPASSGLEALGLLAQKRIDCVVLDAAPPDMSVGNLLSRIQRSPLDTVLPVIVYTEERQSAAEVVLPKAPSPAVAVRKVCSPERLLDQTAFFLHSPVARLSPAKRRMIEELYQSDQVLAGKKVLIVDDDIRNIFALTSTLDWRNMAIVSAETGRDAIQILQEQPDVDIVLMDIMMPEMDGIDTMRAIRRLPQFNQLPIIAVTAKAMKGDREKCIEAGAWDYLSKPVDTEQLLAVLRAWLHR